MSQPASNAKPVFLHPQALCESKDVGAGTRVWAFAHVLPGAKIGEDCNLCDGVFIENDVIVGDRVTIKPGVQLWDGVTLEDDVFVGPNATFTNDPFPRSRVWPEAFHRTVIKAGASIGANATILPGLTIGAGAMVGAGSVVTRDVPPLGVVVGNPARLVRYANTSSVKAPAQPSGPSPSEEGSVRGVQLVKLTRALDMRGALVAAETDKQVPFTPQRVFVVYDVPSAELRGEHAHHTCEQFLICLKGSVNALVDDGEHRAEYRLDRPELGLYMPAMTWGTQFHYSADAVLLVLASQAYDAGDYIRDYASFLELARRAKTDDPAAS